MDRFIAHANIDHYCDALKAERDPVRRATLTNLLIDEEAKLGATSEELAKTEAQISRNRELIARQRALTERLRNNGHETKDAEALLTTLVGTHSLWYQHRKRLRHELGELFDADPEQD